MFDLSLILSMHVLLLFVTFWCLILLILGSCILVAAERLESKLAKALTKVQCRSKEAS